MKRVAAVLPTLPPVTIFESEIVEEEEEVTDPMEITIRRQNDDFFVEGKWLVDLVGSINFSDYESLAYFEKKLIRHGVIKALEEKGCVDGCTVHIYDFEFEFVK